MYKNISILLFVLSCLAPFSGNASSSHRFGLGCRIGSDDRMVGYRGVHLNRLWTAGRLSRWTVSSACLQNGQ